MQQGDFERAQAALEEALALAQQRDPAAVAEALTHLGARAVYAGDWVEGTRLLRAALARCEGLGDAYWSGTALYLLGAAVFAQGNVEEAAALEVDALDRLEAVGDERVAGTAHFGLAVSVRALGDLPRALRHMRAGLEVSVALQDRWLLSIGALAALAIVGERADLARRARLLGAADVLRQGTGALPVWERVAVDQGVGRPRERLEQEEVRAAYREGRALPFGAVASLALSLLEEDARTLAGPETARVAAPTDPSRRARRPAEPARRRGVAAGGSGALQQGDRAAALPLGQHRQPTPDLDLQQAGGRYPGAGGGGGGAARPPVDGPLRCPPVALRWVRLPARLPCLPAPLGAALPAGLRCCPLHRGHPQAHR